MDNQGMDKWKTTVQAHKSGDGIVQVPSSVVVDNDFRGGDVFIGETNVDDDLVLHRAVRISRLVREWNKYQRRIERFGHKFVVLRSNEPVAEIGPLEMDDRLKRKIHTKIR